MPGRWEVFAYFVGIFFQGRFWNFFFATGGLQEHGELLARKSRAGGGQGAPGGLRGRFLETFGLLKQCFFLLLLFELPWHGVFRLHLDSFLFDFLSV